MRKPATLVLLTAFGCGGAGDTSRESTTPAETMAPAPAPVASEAPDAPTATEASVAPDAAAASLAPVEPAPAPAARVELRLVAGDKPAGTMTFQQTDGGIVIAGEFTGLKKGPHALYIHTKGDCSAKGSKVGGHLDPTGAKHGPPGSPMRHAGDFGDVTADKTGKASFEMTTDSITLAADRPDGVVGRAVVIHSRKDNAKGSAGGAIACGVVVLDDGQAASSTSGTTPQAASSTP